MYFTITSKGRGLVSSWMTDHLPHMRPTFFTEIYIFETKVEKTSFKGIILAIFAAAMILFLNLSLDFQAS